uniref:Uncharacterized protein n=1 Tax=Oryza rufipogon TaxID=4529 RepID=A0A0E0N8Q3_ORYRU
MVSDLDAAALSRIEKKNNTALHLKTVMSNVQSQEGSTAYEKPFTEEMIMIDGGGGAARWPGKHASRFGLTLVFLGVSAPPSPISRPPASAAAGDCSRSPSLLPFR